jgi:type I site-specific restriction endonuclease
MVPPWIHIVKGSGSKGVDVEKVDADYNALFKSITSAFFAHEKKIKECSYSADEIGGKVLVVCRDQDDLIEMHKTKAWEDFRLSNPDIHMFALSTKFGILNDDEYIPSPVTNAKKFKMIKKVKELKSSEKCIIFHIDMVSEGIDVSGITGVMPFRNCEMSKFIQNIGRAARLHKTDRINLYKGKIAVGDGKWIKPYSWIIIPEFLANSEGFAGRFRDIIEKLRNEYGFLPKENTLINNDKGLTPDELIDTDNELKKSKAHSKSGIDTFTHIFDEMSALERIIYEDEICDKTKEIISNWENLLKSNEKSLTV